MHTHFSDAVFSYVTFSHATFEDNAAFTGAVFADEADFTGVSFGSFTNFENTLFKGQVGFIGRTMEQWTSDVEAFSYGMDEEAFIALKQRPEECWTRLSSGPDRFLSLSFANARFYDEADFSGRSFEEAADFTNVRFYHPPNFDAATNASRIDFTGAHIGFAPPGELLHWTEDSIIPLRMRALRKMAEETKNHDLERDLYIEERKAERGVYLRQRWDNLKKEGWKNWPRNFLRLAIHGFWIFIMFLYWALADYGRNVVVPFMWWLVFTFLIFPQLYAALLDRLKHEAGLANAEKYNHAIRMLAFGNAVPFVGPLTIDADLKHFLFCPGFGHCLPIPPEGFQFWVVVQNVVSIVLVFFIGLALRNYFRIK